MKRVTIHPCSDLCGESIIPGDKSISHRAIIFASIADGVSTLRNLLTGHDCMATAGVMQSLGVQMEWDGDVCAIHGRGRYGLMEPTQVLDCQNSGTTMRLLAGLLSAMPFMSLLDGSDQLKTRPMDRVIAPLGRMGGRVFGRRGNTLAPLAILPSRLAGIEHDLIVKSAQVKSAIILAALYANGSTMVHNPGPTRDHTERLLTHMGADISSDEAFVRISPLARELSPIALTIPGDMSSAAFLLVAGLMRAHRAIVLRNVVINASRTGLIDALMRMGAEITIDHVRTWGGENVADIHVIKSTLVGSSFGGEHIVRMIDEIPLLALAASQAHGITTIRDASELKVKESNRISKTVEGLNALGADIEELDDGMLIRGPTELSGGEVSSNGDHRLALLFSIAGVMGKGPTVVHGANVTDDSYPGFFATLVRLGASIDEVEA